MKQKKNNLLEFEDSYDIPETEEIDLLKEVEG